jgi:SpoVK/Ycf46/Vps4 family AAA+-type ATPase
MQRITPVLLAQLSRIFKQKTKPIIVIAATNKPQMIDPAFLRPGRFDRIFYIGLPDKNAREQIIRLQLRNRAHRIENSDIVEIAEKLEGYSGADIENIIEESAFKAFNRRESGAPLITKDDIVEVIEKTPKSVTPDEVQLFKEWARERGLKI